MDPSSFLCHRFRKYTLKRMKFCSDHAWCTIVVVSLCPHDSFFSTAHMYVVSAHTMHISAFQSLAPSMLTSCNIVTTHVTAHSRCNTLQERICFSTSPGPADITVDDYEVVAKFCPGSAPVLRDALSLYSAMAYVPESPDLRQLVTSAISACVLEARPMKGE